MKEKYVGGICNARGKKKKRKRILSVVLAVTMGMSVLTGCGGGVSENSQSAGTVELKGEYQASPFVQAEINSDTVEWIVQHMLYIRNIIIRLWA